MHLPRRILRRNLEGLHEPALVHCAGMGLHMGLMRIGGRLRVRLVRRPPILIGRLLGQRRRCVVIASMRRTLVHYRRWPRRRSMLWLIMLLLLLHRRWIVVLTW